MNDADIIALLDTESERLMPGSTPNVARMGRVQRSRRRRIAGTVACAAVLGVAASTAAFNSQLTHSPSGPTLVSPSESDGAELTCDSGQTNQQTLDIGFTESGGQATLDDLGNALLAGPLIATSGASDFTVKEASQDSGVLLMTTPNGTVVGEVDAVLHRGSWFAESIRTCTSAP